MDLFFFLTRQHFYRYDEVEAVARVSARLQPDLSALTALSDTHYRSSSNPSRGHFLPVVRTGRLKGGKASGACSCHLASAARRKHFAGFPAEWALQVQSVASSIQRQFLHAATCWSLRHLRFFSRWEAIDCSFLRVRSF